MKNYAPKQLKILQLISNFQKENGYIPSYAELAKILNISTVTIYEHICALEKKGAILKKYHKKRSIEILDPEFRNDIAIQIKGTITIGQPIIKTEPKEFILTGFNGNCYALRVKGNELTHVYILNNDILIIEKMKPTIGQLIITYDDNHNTAIYKCFNDNLIVDVIRGVLRLTFASEYNGY